MSFQVFQCVACGGYVFPARYFCPACGEAQWRDADASLGVVAEATVLRHRAGSGSASGPACGPCHVTHLATIDTQPGPSVIALLDEALPRGTEVELDLGAGDRLVARRRTKRV